MGRTLIWYTNPEKTRTYPATASDPRDVVQITRTSERFASPLPGEGYHPGQRFGECNLQLIGKSADLVKQ